jgi:thiol-disulfide isomerase/thioredoxin
MLTRTTTIGRTGTLSVVLRIMTCIIQPQYLTVKYNRMQRPTFLFLIFLFNVSPTSAQSVRGTFLGHAGQEIRLQGFDGFDTYLVSTSIATSEGHFQLKYSTSDIGMAYLIGPDDQSFLLVLSGEEVLLLGESLARPESIRIIRGEQNKLFEQYASEHPRREQTLSAWVYLDKIYQSDSLFSAHSRPSNDIAAEINRIKTEDEGFLNQLDPDSYLHWYLPVRKTVSLVPVVAQFRTEEIPQTLAALRALDLTDWRLLRSGLLSDALESHVWLIENSGRSLDSVFMELNVSIDILIDHLSDDATSLNLVMSHLYALLERRSLFRSAEYMALRLLNDFATLLRTDLASKLESHRAMRVGNVAADFPFSNHTIRPPENLTNSLSEVDADYIAVMVLAGWCSACQQLIPSVVSHYPKWKEKGVEVVVVSLDESQTVFQEIFSNVPFIVTTDLVGWDSPIAKAYHVYEVPTFYLLDRDRHIMLRPYSAEHLESWIDWYLVHQN